MCLSVSKVSLVLFYLVTSEHFLNSIFPLNVYKLTDELQLKYDMN